VAGQCTDKRDLQKSGHCGKISWQHWLLRSFEGRFNFTRSFSRGKDNLF